MIKAKGKHRTVSALAIAALILTPAVASAVTGDVGPATLNTLNTGAHWADNGQSYHACNVFNITVNPVAVKVDLIDSAGNFLVPSAAAVTLAPGGFLEVANFAMNYTGFARCRFLVGGNPEYVRANISVFHSTGTFFETLATEIAR
jgi:hypothetical protein